MKYRVAVDARPVFEVEADDDAEAVELATSVMYGLRSLPASPARLVEWLSIRERTTVEAASWAK